MGGLSLGVSVMYIFQESQALIFNLLGQGRMAAAACLFMYVCTSGGDAELSARAAAAHLYKLLL